MVFGNRIPFIFGCGWKEKKLSLFAMLAQGTEDSH